MKNLNYQLKQLCRQNRDGSYSTQSKRMHHLMLIANQLHALGFHGMNARSLKPKHVDALVKQWLAQALSTGTIKNRMAVLRWWAGKVDKQNVVARSNDHYGIPNRRFVTNDSKAKTVDTQDLAKIPDPRIRMSLELQQAFGLRREEAIKFQPAFADRGDHLRLKASWTKGGEEQDDPDPKRHPACTTRPGSQAGRERFTDPTGPQLRPAASRVRATHRQRRTLPDARAAPCLCPAAVPGADRLALAGGGRSESEAAEPGAEGPGSPGATHHQPGAWPYQAPNTRNLRRQVKLKKQRSPLTGFSILRSQTGRHDVDPSSTHHPDREPASA